MKELYIIGAGGFGREVAWLVERINQKNPEWEIVGFIDDDPHIHGKKMNRYTVLGDDSFLKNKEGYVVCAIGSARIREKVIKKLYAYEGIQFATVIDPSVNMSDLVSVGEGCIICAGTNITVDVKIGNHVIINLDCTLGHDDVICDYVTLYPSVNVSGMVTVGKGTELGTGTQIIQGLSICNNTIIGAGAVVVRDITEMGTYVGVPVKRRK